GVGVWDRRDHVPLPAVVAVDERADVTDREASIAPARAVERGGDLAEPDAGDRASRLDRREERDAGLDLRGRRDVERAAGDGDLPGPRRRARRAPRLERTRTGHVQR